ncbi:Protein TPX2, partial [Mucuna pruriens]
EFHLETLARAYQNADTTSIASTKENSWKPHHLTEPKTPLLQTSLRARPPKSRKSLKKIPKFKAKPLNKKIFESKGDIGIFCHTKKHNPTPPAAAADLFGKSEPAHHPNPISRKTIPNPFHLHTKEKGAEKEKKLIVELLHKQLEEENSRIPKVNPYPYTTNYPVVPPKPEPKQCTRPEPFQLESLVRHEEEMQKGTGRKTENGERRGPVERGSNPYSRKGQQTPHTSSG